MGTRVVVLVATAFAMAVALLVPSVAGSSITVSEGHGAISERSLKVAANGDAEVRWTDSQGRHTLLVKMTQVAKPLDGCKCVFPGGRISSANVAVPSTTWVLPFRPILMKGPDDFFYALQTWKLFGDDDPQLRFSRWQGKPTRLTVKADVNARAPTQTSRTTHLHKPRPDITGQGTLSGRATFRGKPVFGKTPTGYYDEKQKIFVKLACRGCPRAKGTGWARIGGGEEPRPLDVGGKQLKKLNHLGEENRGRYTQELFRLIDGKAELGEIGKSYRAQLKGPNRGVHFGPDAQAFTRAVVRPIPPPPAPPAKWVKYSCEPQEIESGQTGVFTLRSADDAPKIVSSRLHKWIPGKKSDGFADYYKRTVERLNALEWAFTAKQRHFDGPRREKHRDRTAAEKKRGVKPDGLAFWVQITNANDKTVTVTCEATVLHGPVRDWPS